MPAFGQPWRGYAGFDAPAVLPRCPGMTDVLGPIGAIGALAFVTSFVIVSAMRRVIVYPWETVLLYRGGAFERVLPPGTHRYVDWGRTVRIVRLANHPQRTTLGPIDVISADRFSFRVHLSATWSILDARAAWEAQEVGEVGGYAAPPLTEHASAAALAAIGTRSLDDVIGDPADVAAAIRERLPTNTLAVEDVAITRFELPPETRRMLTEVERARREGAAALERARAEQASLRALANAARLVKDNPELAQLRLLKTIEDAKGPTTIVIGDPRGASAT